jgi:membrane protein insertase Oxa1/YidC/SpoIIIJ
VGRTVPAYRLAAERERRKWKVFRERLDKDERKLFDEMMSYPRMYNVAGIGACKPVLIQPMLMSIIFEHYKQLNALRISVQGQK